MWFSDIRIKNAINLYITPINPEELAISKDFIEKQLSENNSQFVFIAWLSPKSFKISEKLTHFINLKNIVGRNGLTD